METTFSMRQFIRRVRLDPDVPQLAKDHLIIVFTVIRSFQASSRYRQSQQDVLDGKSLDYQGREFSPAWDYDDLVQDLLCTMIYQAIPKFQPALGVPFGAWAYVVLKRRMRRLWEVDRANTCYGDLAHPWSLEEWMSTADTLQVDAVEATDSVVAVEQFAQSLPRRQRAIFNLKCGDERLSNREIAVLLGLSNKQLIKRDIDDIKCRYVEYGQ